MSKGSLHTLLLTAWDGAANSKDQVEQRASQLSSMLALLTECYGQPWFEKEVADQIKRTYPKPYRCLLDAVLQAFVSACPLHCGPVLQGFMQIPGCVTLNSPFRRDLAALFKATTQLQSCWPQQGVVVCSIVTCLATAASTQLWELSQQQQSLDTQYQQQELGTALSWLVDCLLHAVPSQLLTLMQLLLATAVYQANKQMAAQQAGQSHAGMQPSAANIPPAKKPRLGQQHQQPQVAETTSSPSIAAPNQQAIHLGMQLLTAVCCCEHVQHKTRLMVPYAAAAAASTAVGSTNKAAQVVRYGSWLYRQLSSQVSAAPAGSSTAPGPAASSAATLPANTSGLGAKQDLMSDALQPYAALVHVLQQLSDYSPVLLLEFVRLIMGLPERELTQSAAATAVSGQLTAASLTRSESADGSINSFFCQQLVQAARQWLPVAEAAPGQRKKQKGKKSTRQQQHHKQTPQQASMQGNASPGVSIIQAPALSVKQVLPDTSSVNATWVCKHVVPILVQAAHAQWSQQQQQPSSSAQLPTTAALVQLLSAEGMLLPAAGEVLVSARVLAGALNSLQVDLQCIVAEGWQQQLHQQAVAAAYAGTGHQHPGRLVAWMALQPMLCLLSSLELRSPFAELLVKRVQRCIGSSPATSTSSQQSTDASSARDILQHILLPVRFGLKMPARIWLLQQLLTRRQHSACAAPGEIAAAASTALDASLSVASTAIEDVDSAAVLLTVLSNLLKTDWQKQLAQGLQLLARQQQQQQQQGMPGGKSAAVSLQQAHGMDLATALTGLLGEVDNSHTNGGGAAGVSIEGDWQLQVAQQLRLVLQAADAAAYDAIMLASPPGAFVK